MTSPEPGHLPRPVYWNELQRRNSIGASVDLEWWRQEHRRVNVNWWKALTCSKKHRGH